MITVFGEGRGFRVVWLLEEMGLPYRLRRVDLLAGVENDPEFLSINPAGFIPALQDGDVPTHGGATMAYVVELVGTQEYSFTPAEFLERLTGAYGEDAAADVAPRLLAEPVHPAS